MSGSERRRSWREQMRDDSGTTLMELMVGMMIMTIFLGLFSGAIVLLYQSSNKAIALTTSASQTDQAFARLDKSVRYAAAFDAPVLGTAGWSVVYRTAAATTTAGGSSTATPICTQLRLNTQVTGQPSGTAQLQARTWTSSANGTSATNISAWIPWASQITNGGAAAGTAQPFILSYQGTSVNYEQLTVQLTAATGSPAVPAQTNATFTALNSAAAQQLASVSGTPTSGCPLPASGS